MFLTWPGILAFGILLLLLPPAPQDGREPGASLTDGRLFTATTVSGTGGLLRR